MYEVVLEMIEKMGYAVSLCLFSGFEFFHVQSYFVKCQILLI